MQRKMILLYLSKKNVIAISSACLVGFLFKWWIKYEVKSVTGTKSKTKIIHRKTVPGLLNVGNSCFMNSLLQSLAGSKNFMKWLVSSQKAGRNQACSYFSSTLLSLVQLLTNISDFQVEPYYDPSEILTDLGARGWEISMEQQDAHEFMQVLMSTLGEEYDHLQRKNMKVFLYTLNDIHFDENFKFKVDKRADNPIKGRMLTQLTCQTCGFKNSIRAEDFVSISAPLPQRSFSKITINDCLNIFFQQEIVHDVTCEKCTQLHLSQTNTIGDASTTVNTEQCESTKKKRVTFVPKHSLKLRSKNWIFNTTKDEKWFNQNKSFKINSDFSKNQCIGKLPESLCIHLQRLVWCGGMPIKRQDYVDFPEVINLQNYFYTSNFTMFKPSKHAFQKEKTPPSKQKKSLEKLYTSLKNPVLQDILMQKVNKNGLLGGSSSYNAENSMESDSTSNPNCEYELQSVIVHLGSWSFAGHYVCYRKISGIDQQRNESLSRWLYISDTIVRFAKKEEVFSSPAYMLFYERKQ